MTQAVMIRVGVLALLAVVGCKKEEPAPSWVPPQPVHAPVAASAVPSGLLEGKLEAFGVHLPHRSRLAMTTPDLVVVEIPHGVVEVEEFLRARLEGALRDVGPRGTILSNASVPGVEGSLLDVTIERSASASRVTLLRRSVALSKAGAEAVAAPASLAARRMKNM